MDNTIDLVLKKMQKLKSGKRLDLQIMEFFPNLTRSSIKNLIHQEVITVENEKKLPNYKPKDGEELTYRKTEIDRFLKNNGELKLTETKMKIDVLFEDEFSLFVFKPIGIQVHPVTKNDTKSLMNGVYYYLSHDSKFSGDVRIRLVNRIDKETSGIVVISKSLESHDFYSKQFEARNLKKEYLAIVKGDFEDFLYENNLSSLYIEDYLSKSSNNKNRYYSTSSQYGRLARTDIEFISDFKTELKGKYSKLLVRIKTGRTHQIRVHLSELGFPILGDTLYGGPKFKRLMLHAYRLKIVDFKSKKEIVIEAKEPQEFR